MRSMGSWRATRCSSAIATRSWTEAFRRIVEGAGVRIVQIPVQAPNAGNPGSPQTVGTAVESCFNAKLWLESRVLVLCPQHDVGSAGSVTDSLRGMQPASRSSCPGCEPGADPLGETLELRWCEVHAPSRAGLDDGRVHFDAQRTWSEEAGGEENRRWCDLLHRPVRYVGSTGGGSALIVPDGASTESTRSAAAHGPVDSAPAPRRSR